MTENRTSVAVVLGMLLIPTLILGGIVAINLPSSCKDELTTLQNSYLERIGTYQKQVTDAIKENVVLSTNLKKLQVQMDELSVYLAEKTEALNKTLDQNSVHRNHIQKLTIDIIELENTIKSLNKKLAAKCGKAIVKYKKCTVY